MGDRLIKKRKLSNLKKVEDKVLPGGQPTGIASPIWCTCIPSKIIKFGKDHPYISRKILIKFYLKWRSDGEVMGQTRWTGKSSLAQSSGWSATLWGTIWPTWKSSKIVKLGGHNPHMLETFSQTFESTEVWMRKKWTSQVEPNQIARVQSNKRLDSLLQELFDPLARLQNSSSLVKMIFTYQKTFPQNFKSIKTRMKDIQTCKSGLVQAN